MEHLGIDVHQKYSEICWLAEEGEVKQRRRLPTTEASLRRFFGRIEPVRVVLESSCVTPWVSRLLGEMGHEVVVLNPRRVRLIAESTLKSDTVDAEILARLSRFDLTLLRPVYQRSEAAQELRTRLRVRGSLVKARTALINAVRGSLRSQGYRMGSCPTRSFVARWFDLRLAPGVREVLEPLVETIAELTDRIDVLERELKAASRSDELMLRLQDVPGVGPLVSLAYVGWMDRAERFERSRDVGACLGLRPRVRDSGGKLRRGAITREGDCEMRRLLVQAAHAALNSKKDFQLRRWAEALVERVGKSKAVVALARKIAVLLHRLWVSGQRYRPFPRAA
jgi:transposase